MGEKMLLGVGTLGMIPALESLDSNSEYWGKVAICQRCGTQKKIK
jgi:hypothetical protein